ncbi:MAG: DUF357 domain-containing protein [Candidatus Aenigmarchaeota archaeon CG_4_10_14_0_8_um_filter_37_24]|nr:DUF357 domain-containing protein [Candidatus Aenigmarchaeota archaeon]OIN87139.1 MAG: hypothetical protein AUJ50_03125 [Candidatus Aenigmarchaeota archaeon CG1_02_38_14]PIV68202.1 MAG: DUF357 domain-containing protein [Candidatus Aenigmarchaeota archaeon CG01_land_8_20_14_3_00_37_9]PIW41543.1 MAG: DUF357 domain-containing protein [Candidatus Aenigmarchaeota archaeon CG15_BIG_FIL_POST_REV_8_21_14_020_37_27]PIX51088.1 MAG: DUF357 domain-containing protein [Candidatus Aenigmarchaeota archaeon C
MVKDKIPKELIEKWLNKLKKKMENVKPADKKGEELLKNIQAYIIDTEHFLDQGDYIRAWEAISFDWGLFEAGEDLKVLKD